MKRSLILPLTLIFLGLISAACSSFLLGSAGGGEQKVKAAHHSFDSAVGAYLTIQPPTTDPGTSRAAWQPFLAEGDRLISKMEQAYTEWETAVHSVYPVNGKHPDTRDHHRYLDLAGRWVSTQKRQAAASRGCIDQLSLGQDRASTCYARLLTDPSLQLSVTERQEMQGLAIKLYA